MENQTNVDEKQFSNNRFYETRTPRIHSWENVRNISVIPFQKNDFREDCLKAFLQPYPLKVLSITSSIQFECLKCSKTSSIKYSEIKYRIKSKLPICSKCNPIASFPEKSILSFISEISSTTIIPNDRKILRDMELDIYLPERFLAFEFNGLYWHCEENKPKQYHKIKTEYAEKRGVHLIHIWEDDWAKKTNIVKSYIRNLLLENEQRIYVKDCTVKKIPEQEAIEFFKRNSLQEELKADICFGIFTDRLVSVMCFRKIKNVWNMVYFCNDLNTVVIGGYREMFSEFVKEYCPEEVVSIACRDWFVKESLEYKSLGFEFAKYIGVRSVKRSGLKKVWNSGYIKFVWRKNGLNEK